MTGTYTITLGDCAENGVGMEQIGEKAIIGYTPRRLRRMARYWKKLDSSLEPELIHLGEDAWVLVVRGGVNAICDDADELLEELQELEWDRKALQRGRVVNKHARYNLCFSEVDREPDYPEGKGRLIAWSSVSSLWNAAVVSTVIYSLVFGKLLTGM